MTISDAGNIICAKDPQYVWAFFLLLTPPAYLQGEGLRALARLSFSGRSFILSHLSLSSPTDFCNVLTCGLTWTGGEGSCLWPLSWVQVLRKGGGWRGGMTPF